VLLRVLSRLPNPVRLLILWIGLSLARAGLVDERRAGRTTDLAWPRIVTGLARKSKTTIDIAMVGIAIGPAAIAGIGFAGPFWGLAFTVGGGLATGAIALVSQRYGAEEFDQIGQAVRTNSLLVLVATLPITAGLFAFSTELIAFLTDSQRTIEIGASYLRVVAWGVPFAGLNLVGGRVLVGADDAWTPMIVRAGGAVANIGLNAVLIFGLGMGVVGAALGTVVANVVVTVAFAVGLGTGGLPGVGAFPVSVSFRGPYVHRETVRDVVRISTPAIGRRMMWTGARFPLLTFVALYGSHVVAAYVISRQIWGLVNTPGWGFGLSASSLVGQSLGDGDERLAETYAHEITRISVATYTLGAIITFAFADSVVVQFVDDPTSETVTVAVALVRAASISVIARGVGGTYAGALDATGDTRWPFYSRAVGMFGTALPLTYLGATTPLGLYGLYLSYFGQSVVPAIVNYYRFSTGRWKVISQRYRPKSTTADD
jgi:putative MATE family efflux protein